MKLAKPKKTVSTLLAYCNLRNFHPELLPLEMYVQHLLEVCILPEDSYVDAAAYEQHYKRYAEAYTCLVDSELADAEGDNKGGCHDRGGVVVEDVGKPVLSDMIQYTCRWSCSGRFVSLSLLSKVSSIASSPSQC